VKRSRIKFDIVFSLDRLHRYGTRILAVIYDRTFKAPIWQGKLTYIVRDLYWRVWNCQFGQPIFSLYWKLKMEYRCNIGGFFYIEAKKNTTNFPTQSETRSQAETGLSGYSDSPFLVIGTVSDHKVARMLLHLRSGQSASIKVVVSLPFNPVVIKLRQCFSEWRWENLFCYRTTLSLEWLLYSLTWQALICVEFYLPLSGNGIVREKSHVWLV